MNSRNDKIDIRDYPFIHCSIDRQIAGDGLYVFNSVGLQQFRRAT